MTQKEIKIFSNRVGAFLDSRRLSQAIAELADMARRNSNWHVFDSVKQAEQAYAYMLQYVAQGAADPERADVYNSIVSDLYSALDQLVQDLKMPETTGLYFSALRINAKENAEGRIADLLNKYAESASRTSLFSMVADNAKAADTAEQERLQNDLFNAIWITPRLKQADADALGHVLESADWNESLKIHIISALMLGQLQRADSRKAELMMMAYMAPNSSMRVSSAALTGLLISLWRYAKRPLPRRLANRLAAIKEMPHWASDLRIAFMELVRAHDTERINKKMHDEVIPGMMNLRPEILNKINDGKIDPNDIAALQENPEWQELLDKNGITDKLKELTDLQMEGGDVMMSAFSNLKNFPFFYQLPNWFLPFSASNTYISSISKEMPLLADLMENSVMLCDNDKYSFMLAFKSTPEAQRDMLTKQFMQQSEAMYEAMGKAQYETDQPEARKRTLNSYMQNIYRFFKLFNRKDEFFDPFDKGVNLLAVPSLKEDVDDTTLLEVVAEFYFKHGYWANSLNAFQRLDAIAETSAARYQKMGYAYERLGQHNKAIDLYLKAELLDNRSLWTLRRLAACYRASGNSAKALEYYNRLADLDPENTSVALQLGYALLERGDYADAIKQFYKVEFLDEKGTKAFRPLAWALFLRGDFAGAQRYYDKVMASGPTANDLLNMGHVALASGRPQEAIDLYSRSAKMRSGGFEEFLQAYDEDAPSLIAAGVDPSLLPLIADATELRTS